jgi:hypothetical protein
MSDISIEFDWYVLPLVVLIIGWPGLLIGGIVGAITWRWRRIVGALLGALLGTAMRAGGFYLWG